ncbi:hypothetical protein MTP39_09255 [Faecalibacterium sp. I3-3-33]|uniref:hypothetical protein n=1 Tax=Faecalibacterium sp. I3-3-33 TaxID=2929492 RepID=UPI002014E7E5|nr:hypothetical protein [Faecalibacterium sp. I3-3-33]UQK44768.1 hypothetical protein MTP39_09255 [Faecalibacterium sp. I3-3-33]
MRLFARHRAEMPSRAPSHRLLWASLLLALLLLLTFGAALFLFISLHNTKKDTVRSLEIRNIYTKLGINSLKQLQQCIAVLHSDGTGTALPEPPHEAAEPENKEDELPMTD